jgi:hypothetical protein
VFYTCSQEPVFCSEDNAFPAREEGRKKGTMPEVSIDQQRHTLNLQVEAIERLWVFNSHMEIPLAHVKGASIDPELASKLPYPGQDVGDVQWHEPVTVGTFYQHGKRVYWDVSDPSKAVVIELKDDRYAELVIQVDDPAATVKEINQAIGART